LRARKYELLVDTRKNMIKAVMMSGIFSISDPSKRVLVIEEVLSPNACISDDEERKMKRKKPNFINNVSFDDDGNDGNDSSDSEYSDTNGGTRGGTNRSGGVRYDYSQCSVKSLLEMLLDLLISFKDSDDDDDDNDDDVKANKIKCMLYTLDEKQAIKLDRLKARCVSTSSLSAKFKDKATLNSKRTSSSSYAKKAEDEDEGDEGEEGDITTVTKETKEWLESIQLAAKREEEEEYMDRGRDRENRNSDY
jgi:hypothetical protein